MKDIDWQLIFSIRRNDIEAVKLALKNGADVNIKSDGSTPLIYAVKINSLEIVKLLIEKDADINIKDIWGYTALMYACINNNLEIVKLLIKKGANVNAQDNGSWTALMHACQKANFKPGELLNDDEIDIGIKTQDNNRLTALMYAIYDYKTDLNIIKYLIEKNADINIIDDYGNTALAYAIDKKNKEIIDLLIEKKANIEINGDKGFRVLATAIKSNDLELIELFTGRTNRFLLFIRRFIKNIFSLIIEILFLNKILKFLPKSNKDCFSPKQNLFRKIFKMPSKICINAKDYNDTTILMKAVYRGNIYVIKHLINEGAEKYAVDKDRKTPSSFTDRAEILKLFEVKTWWEKHGSQLALIVGIAGIFINYLK